MANTYFLCIVSGGGRGLGWRGIEKEEGILSSFEKLSLNCLAHVVDEMSIPPFKIDILWAMGGPYLGSYLIPTWFLAPMAFLKFRPCTENAGTAISPPPPKKKIYISVWFRGFRIIALSIRGSTTVLQPLASLANQSRNQNDNKKQSTNTVYGWVFSDWDINAKCQVIGCNPPQTKSNGRQAK